MTSQQTESTRSNHKKEISSMFNVPDNLLRSTTLRSDQNRIEWNKFRNIQGGHKKSYNFKTRTLSTENLIRHLCLYHIIIRNSHATEQSISFVHLAHDIFCVLIQHDNIIFCKKLQLFRLKLSHRLKGAHVHHEVFGRRRLFISSRRK